MVFQLPELTVNSLGVTYVVAGIAAAIVVITRLVPRGPNFDAFPTVGPSGWLGSRLAGIKNLINMADVVQEGYERHKRAPFKVAELYNWQIVLSNREHIEEFRRAPDDIFSMNEGIRQRLNFDYMLGDESTYHFGNIVSQLTRNIGTLYPEVRDEIVTAFGEVLCLRGHEWKSVLALDAIRRIVGRTSNRVFVGLPLCRDPDWIDLNIQYTIDVAKGSLMIGLFPKFIRHLAAYFFRSASRQGRERGLKLAGPIIEERLKNLNVYGNDWDEKPNDLLLWLMEEAEGPHLSANILVARLLFINFASIHTTSNSFTTALFYLAANPQYIQPLREEVEAIVEKEGWSKDSVSKMRKVDSFLRECQRMEGITVLSMTRMALQDFTFSDGTVIPKGALISIASRPLHYDEEYYENPHVFKPFRFADMHDEDGTGVKNQFVTTANEYLSFGYGRHACPGRFFAANELKTMLAHVVTTYDIKLEDGVACPRSVHYGVAVTPDPRARVLFRKRVD